MIHYVLPSFRSTFLNCPVFLHIVQQGVNTLSYGILSDLGTLDRGLGKGLGAEMEQGLLGCTVAK